MVVCGSASRVRQPHAGRRIYRLRDTATRELRYEPRPMTAGRFTMDDPRLVQQVFPSG